MQGDWGISFFKQWERILKVNSFTDEGKMVWAKACGLEEEFKELLSNFSDLKLHPDAYINGNGLLTSYKNCFVLQVPSSTPSAAVLSR